MSSFKQQDSTTRKPTAALCTLPVIWNYCDCKYQGAKLSPSLFFKKKNKTAWGRGSGKPQTLTCSFLQETRPRVWFGEKCCSHFKSHHSATKQAPVMCKAGHIFLKLYQRFQKEKQTLYINLATGFQDWENQNKQKGCNFWYAHLSERELASIKSPQCLCKNCP